MKGVAPLSTTLRTQWGIEPVPHELQPCALYAQPQIVFTSLPKDMLYLADWDIQAQGVKFLLQPH